MKSTVYFTFSLTFITCAFGKFFWATLPDYDVQVTEIPKRNLRANFLERKRDLEREKLLKTNTALEMFEGIAHFKDNNRHPRKHKVDAFEKELRRLFSMNGVKYNYKRDYNWRTWRKVKFSNGTTSFVHYKCSNRVNATEGRTPSQNRNCGMWLIEEDRVQCPYEIWSVFSRYELCCTFVTNIANISAKCPSKISYSDLSSCDNPIKTTLRVNRDYGVRNKTLHSICQGRESCYIHTFYQILDQSVIFRLINSTQDIIYSKLMKPGENFICVDDCGHFNLETDKIIQKDNPLKLSLLEKQNARKKKREFRFKKGKNTKTKLCIKRTKKIKKVPIPLEKDYSDENGIDYLAERREEDLEDDKKPFVFQC